MPADPHPHSRTESLRTQPQQRRLERLAWLLDESVRLPGGFRIGLDAIVGLIPGIGDGIGLATSSYILLEAFRLGASKAVLLRMGFNVILETVLGAVPVLGDLFDMVWKANRRNVDLLQRHVADPRPTRRLSWFLIVGFVLTVLLLCVLLFALTIMIIRAILGMS